jgi:hypothetical protein
VGTRLALSNLRMDADLDDDIPTINKRYHDDLERLVGQLNSKEPEIRDKCVTEVGVCVCQTVRGDF